MKKKGTNKSDDTEEEEKKVKKKKVKKKKFFDRQLYEEYDLIKSNIPIISIQGHKEDKGFDGKGPILFKRFKSRKSFADQVKFATENGGRLLTFEEVRAFMNVSLNGKIDCAIGDYFAIYPTRVGEGKDWICGRYTIGSPYKCLAGETYLQHHKQYPP